MKKSVVFGLLSAAILLAIVWLAFSRPLKEAYIQGQIDKANYCETREDCILVGSKCPFGCYIYSNKAEFDRIKGIVDEFDSRCVYGCANCPTVECVDNKCQSACE